MQKERGEKLVKTKRGLCSQACFFMNLLFSTLHMAVHTTAIRSQANEFLRNSRQAYALQFLRQTASRRRRLLRDGGAVPAAQMLQHAIHATFLPKPVQVKEIIKWAKMVGSHNLAAARWRAAGSVSDATVEHITMETAELIADSLFQAGLVSAGARSKLSTLKNDKK
jgi:hypothetical protein